jgi:hypothetical protein
VAHFDRFFQLGLTAEDRADLVAYLTAVGDGQTPAERDGVIPRLKEITDFASVLGTAIPARILQSLRSPWTRSAASCAN